MNTLKGAGASTRERQLGGRRCRERAGGWRGRGTAWSRWDEILNKIFEMEVAPTYKLFALLTMYKVGEWTRLNTPSTARTI